MTQSNKHLAYLKNIIGRNDSYEMSIDLNQSIESNTFESKVAQTPYFSIDFNHTTEIIKDFDVAHGIQESMRKIDNLKETQYHVLQK